MAVSSMRMNFGSSASPPSSVRWRRLRPSRCSITSASRSARCDTSGSWFRPSPPGSGIGPPFYRHAGVLAGAAERLQRRAPILSLLAAIILTGVGLAVALSKTLPGSAWIGGMIVGGGIAFMHYAGMAAFEIEGSDRLGTRLLVVVSIALGAAIGAIALWAGLNGDSMRSRIYGALLC